MSGWPIDPASLAAIKAPVGVLVLELAAGGSRLLLFRFPLGRHQRQTCARRRLLGAGVVERLLPLLLLAGAAAAVPASSVRQRYAVRRRTTTHQRVGAARLRVADAGVAHRHETPEAVRVARAPLDARQPAQSELEPVTEPIAPHPFDQSINQSINQSI